jgi:hypothetical protein
MCFPISTSNREWPRIVLAGPRISARSLAGCVARRRYLRALGIEITFSREGRARTQRAMPCPTARIKFHLMGEENPA